jgi:hypothetical protein
VGAWVGRGGGSHRSWAAGCHWVEIAAQCNQDVDPASVREHAVDHCKPQHYSIVHILMENAFSFRAPRALFLKFRKIQISKLLKIQKKYLDVAKCIHYDLANF